MCARARARAYWPARPVVVAAAAAAAACCSEKHGAMAAQLYSHTSLAECLYDVLNEMVTEGLIHDDLAVSTLNQLETVRKREISRGQGRRRPRRASSGVLLF